MISTPETPAVVTHGPVGIGHRLFAETEIHALRDRGIAVTMIDPSEEGSLITREIWQSFKAGYLVGSSGALAQTVYEKIRRNSDKGSALVTAASAEIATALKDYPGIVIADHSYVSNGAHYLIQGDVTADNTYAHFPGYIFTTTDEAIAELTQNGHREELIHKVGFFVPKELKSETAAAGRLDRIRHGDIIHVGFFGSGASPAPHFKILHEVLLPQLQSLLKSGRTRLTVYTAVSGKRADDLYRHARSMGLSVSIATDGEPDDTCQVNILFGRTPEDALRLSVQAAKNTDTMITMMNERVAWARYIPLIALPPIGINAKGNTKFATEMKRMVLPVEAAYSFAYVLQRQMQNGAAEFERLLESAADIPVDGAEVSSGIIFDRLRQTG